jgi:hypothetical protein
MRAVPPTDDPDAPPQTDLPPLADPPPTADLPPLAGPPPAPRLRPAAVGAVLTYAEPDTPPPAPLPGVRRPIPPEVKPAVCGCVLALLSSCTNAWAVFVYPAMACVGWYMALRLRRERDIAVRWKWGMGLSATAAAGCTFVALGALCGSPYWIEWVWVREPAVRWGTYGAAASVLAYVACDRVGRDRANRPPSPAPPPMPPGR